MINTRARACALTTVTVLALSLIPAAAYGDQPAELVVLGDSYSAGEGLGPYESGTDTPEGPNACHRSSQAYGRLAANELGYSYVNRACSKAVIQDLTQANSKNMHEPPQTGSIGALGPRDAVAMTIGGNDAEWVDLLSSCTRLTLHGNVINDASPTYDPADCQRRKNDGDTTVESVATRLLDQYRAIMQATDAQVYVLLYPPMIPARAPDAQDDCSTENLAEQGSLGLSADTSRRMVQLEIELNQRIRQNIATLGHEWHATRSQLHLVDIEQTFGGYEGHTISCGFSDRPKPWINALRFDVLRFIGNGNNEAKQRIRTGFYTSGSFHPTSEGQRHMANALVGAIRSRR